MVDPHRHRFNLDPERITLPKGTRVVLKVDRPALDEAPAESFVCKAGTVGVVVEVAYDSYVVRSAAGRKVRCQRDQLTIQKHDQLPAIARRQLAWEQLKGRVCYSAVVGSTAWGLADADSDEDLRGVFTLPFEAWAGLTRPVEEIADPQSDTQHWELAKLIYLALRADAGALELLWSPQLRVCDELGQRLRDERRIFVSRQVFGTFGRYAISQFSKMRRAERRVDVSQQVLAALTENPDADDAEVLAEVARLLGTSDEAMSGDAAMEAARLAIRDVYRSLHDKGLLAERGLTPLRAYLRDHADEIAAAEPPRWKNAYNLLRLLHSGIRWLREGEPLIEVDGEIRDELWAVKRGQWPLGEVLARADALSAELERAHGDTALPEQPDYEAAEALLLAARRRSAAEALATATATSTSTSTATATSTSTSPSSDTTSALAVESLADVEAPADASAPLFEIPRPALVSFLERYRSLDLVICSLVGSHSYGFPSADSDFDLKAIHLAPPEALLGLDAPPQTIDFLDDVDGLEIDFTSHEARFALERLLKGDGNVLERVLSPYRIAPGDGRAAEIACARLGELRTLARANLHRGFFRHYAGFLRGMEKRHEKEQREASEAGASPHRARIKTLLYMFRVALTGVHLLREGDLIADLRALLPRYPQPQVERLLELKEHHEHGTVDDDRAYLALMPDLRKLLVLARDESALPEAPPARAALDDWLRRWRRDAGR
jgi:predicted nucleotidyltransferase